MDGKFLSVVIPVFNGEKSIERTLRSVLRSAPFSYEVIVVDDGSTDATETVVSAVAKEDRRVRLVKQANQGVSVARNKGVEEATGEYVWFVDADDLIARDAYEVLAAVIQQGTGPDIFSFRWRRTCADSLFSTGDVGCRPVVYDMYDRGMAVSAIIACGGKMWAYNALYRRALLDKIRFRRYCNGEDVLFAYMCLMNARSVWDAPLALYGYVDNRDGASKKMTMRHLDSVLNVGEELARLFAEHRHADWFRPLALRHVEGMVNSQGAFVAERIGSNGLALWRMRAREIYLNLLVLPFCDRLFYRFVTGYGMNWGVRLFVTFPIKVKARLLQNSVVARLNEMKNRVRWQKVKSNHG